MALTWLTISRLATKTLSARCSWTVLGFPHNTPTPLQINRYIYSRLDLPQVILCDINVSMSNYTTLEDKPLAEYYRKIIKHNSLRLSKFIDRIIDDFERKGWVDLEETYFSLLYEYRDEAKLSMLKWRSFERL